MSFLRPAQNVTGGASDQLVSIDVEAGGVTPARPWLRVRQSLRALPTIMPITPVAIAAITMSPLSSR
jgi:hypothetical protein